MRALVVSRRWYRDIAGAPNGAPVVSLLLSAHQTWCVGGIFSRIRKIADLDPGGIFSRIQKITNLDIDLGGGHGSCINIVVFITLVVGVTVAVTHEGSRGGGRGLFHQRWSPVIIVAGE
jgi:hypothetical protein